MTPRVLFNHALVRKLAAEALGTALLLAIVVGSGIMGERLAGGNIAIALLANSIATGAGLFVLITMFAPISGAHFNPAVTLIETFSGGITRKLASLYVAAQFAGAVVGVMAANAMFELPMIQLSQHARTGHAQWFSELVATFGLISVILHGAKSNTTTIAAMVACYITAAYWFTASTSFANPAVTFARSLSDTFAGIRMSDAPMFIGAQISGALLAYVLHRWMSRAQ